ncbi:MAG: 3-methyl-2-oxobutanoate dehydrogenase subunit VorB [Kiritimatiellia bacterium]|jgi:2-oxoisovalerate ferredoxin oxidoreductase alpha subunit|nr:3-methyl-2-oxobutanoate dehydrogenase subunit VorB [Kiritimatiellia bacterium]
MTRFVKGNEAVVIGALYAGCDVYFGYPITPASEIAHAAAKWFPSVGREFLQAECETASINMVYGAAAAGTLAMTATSGPGMSLMQEGLSYMAGANLPGVIVNVMRAGPGLGNVYPEQGDYNQAVKGGGHGNYACAVVAPASVQEMCDLTVRAFGLAFAYRTPAIVLADGLLGQMMETLVLPERESPRPDTSDWALHGTAATRTHLVTSIYLDAAAQEEHNLRLQAKYAAMRAEARHETYLCDDAELVLLAYGISSRICRTAAEALRAEGIRAGVFRPVTLNPFPAAAMCAALEGRRGLAVELSAGQFRDDVLLHLAKEGGRVQPIALCNRLGGMVMTVEDVVQAARAVGKR